MIAQEKDYRWFLYQMLRIRMSQEKIAELYPEQEMRCPVHLCVGQEAVPVGVCQVLINSDYVFSCHRSHGHYLAKGGNLQSLFAELYGKSTGCARGRGGSMHLIDVNAGFYGSTSIIAGTIPVAVGSAFSSMLQNQPKITVVFFGDAAVEEGLFHESVNFAVLHQLPVVFVCENNLYSVYTRISRRQPEREIYELVRGHGLESFQGDGNDVLQVNDLARRAVEKARAGVGPTFLEFKTYRWLEHCGPNPDIDLGYRGQEEYDAWVARCPIKKLMGLMKEHNLISESEISSMVQEIDGELESAVNFAKASPFPGREELFQFIYAGVKDE
jgi:TPP-dependent pyruvate/acetoin dehydrogenase alpha subunit